MELNNYSEECLRCKCRSCRHTYKLNRNLSACYIWCDLNCVGGEKGLLRVDIDDNCSDYILIEK